MYTISLWGGKQYSFNRKKVYVCLWCSELNVNWFVESRNFSSQFHIKAIIVKMVRFVFANFMYNIYIHTHIHAKPTLHSTWMFRNFFLMKCLVWMRRLWYKKYWLLYDKNLEYFVKITLKNIFICSYATLDICVNRILYLLSLRGKSIAYF